MPKHGEQGLTGQLHTADHLADLLGVVTAVCCCVKLCLASAVTLAGFRVVRAYVAIGNEDKRHRFAFTAFRSSSVIGPDSGGVT